jgi:hypothetical protein
MIIVKQFFLFFCVEISAGCLKRVSENHEQFANWRERANL